MWAMPWAVHSYFIVPSMVGSPSAPMQGDIGTYLVLEPQRWGQKQRLQQGGSCQEDGAKNKGCSRKDCPCAHICSRCGGQHPNHKCFEVKRPPGNTGNDK